MSATEKRKHHKTFDRRRARYHGLFRAFTVIMVLVFQVLFIMGLTFWLREYSVKIYLAIQILSSFIVFALVSNNEYNQKFWIAIIVALPGFGFILYFFWGSTRKNFTVNEKLRESENEMKGKLPENEEELKKLSDIHPNKIQIARFLARDGFPVYKNTSMKYYPVGDELEEDFLEDLRRAKERIFMEYFIIYNGEWWKEIEEILIQKASEGVDVRILIDDFGSLYMDPIEMKKSLGSNNIKVGLYEPIGKRITSLSFNYRNHQKICVIDSTIGYTGGINIADEYLNKIVRFGHWLDTAIRLEGRAVMSMSATFLTMWEQVVSEDCSGMDIEPKWDGCDEGFVQPFAGGPHRAPHNPVEGAYSRMINKARDYVYITTPYLVLDERMINDLISAALSGVDVRIITPRIYDKWAVYMVTVKNYGRLLKQGVRIYEYVPGFIHEKDAVSDDECAICGTINLDYRSMYIHHENGVFVADSHIVGDIKENILKTIEKSEEISYEKWKKRSVMQKIVQNVLYILSPLF